MYAPSYVSSYLLTMFFAAMFLFNLTFMITIAIVSSIHLPKGIISHPETGLFFQHIGRLAPNERVMNLSMIIPISLSGCYLIPLGIAKSMPACSHLFHWPQSTDHSARLKRDPFGWLMGGAALVVGTINTVAITELRSQILSEANKLRDLQSQVKSHGTALISIRDGAISLGRELKETQNLMTDQSKAIFRLESNDAALNESIAYLAREQQKLHLRQENSLLYQSLIEIFEDRPSLLFLAPSDLTFVIANIFQEAKLNYTALYGHLPTLEAIRMLLTFQAISFHPSTTYNTSTADEIGRFIITNYFALPEPDVYYNVFRLITIPFFHNGIFIKLARIPLYIAQHINNSNTIEWNSDETYLCRFGMVTVCKDVPSIGNGVMTSGCIEQILNNGNLSACQYEPIPSSHSFRVKLIDSWWAISAESEITCLKQPLVPTVLMSEVKIIDNSYLKYKIK